MHQSTAFSTISTSPAKYETVTEQKLAQESGTRIEKIPAQFETVTERIQTAAASTRWEKRKADKNKKPSYENDPDNRCNKIVLHKDWQFASSKSDGSCLISSRADAAIFTDNILKRSPNTKSPVHFLSLL